MRRKRGGSSLVWGGAAVALLMGMLDVMTNQAVTGIVLSMLSVPHINPPPKSMAEKRVPTSPVALFYQIDWTEGSPHDIDMYVQCQTGIPGGQSVVANVNYKQLHDIWLRLSKDDQGRPTILNVEKVESISDILRVPPNTTCVANVHLYHSHGGVFPISGKLIAIHQKDNPTSEEIIGIVDFRLEVPGQEITVLASRWDENGVLEKKSTEMYPAVPTVYIATTPSSGGG